LRPGENLKVEVEVGVEIRVEIRERTTFSIL
jgi:hypothetical protein